MGKSLAQIPELMKNPLKGRLKQDEIVSKKCTPSTQLFDADAQRRGQFLQRDLAETFPPSFHL